MIKPKEIQQSSNPKSESEVSLKPAENTAETTQNKTKVEVTPNKVDTETKAEKPAETAETASEKTQSTPSVPKLSEKEVQEAVNQPWAADNKIVDDRLDDNANDLVKKVRKEVEASVTRGESADKMVDAISKELEADRKRVERIVRTETAAIQNKASIDAYKGLGVDKIQVLGTLDRVTCEKCGSFDGKIFEIDKAQQGLNIPPFHPNCRCTTTPYDEDWEHSGTRNAKGSNGNDYYVPEDMSYEEWKRKFVEGSEVSTGKNSNALERLKGDLADDHKISELATYSEEYNANLDYINSDDFKDAIMSDTTNKATINKEILKLCRKCVKDNNGSNKESYGVIYRDGAKSNFLKSGVYGGYIGEELFKGHAPRSVILTHNHPGSTSFSADDLVTFSEVDAIKTIYAIGHDGTIYRISKSKGSKPVGTNFYAIYNTIVDWCSDIHEAVSRIAEKYGWNYEKL